MRRRHGCNRDRRTRGAAPDRTPADCPRRTSDHRGDAAKAAESPRSAPVAQPARRRGMGPAGRELVPHARPASVHIVRACVQYAASVRYCCVTLSDLSAAAGVSDRRVRQAFREFVHASPTAYLRVAALLEVRRVLLERSSARDAVTRAASDFGFWHLSRFAAQYRTLFGESPGETVARARARDAKPASAATVAIEMR